MSDSPSGSVLPVRRRQIRPFALLLVIQTTEESDEVTWQAQGGGQAACWRTTLENLMKRGEFPLPLRWVSRRAGMTWLQTDSSSTPVRLITLPRTFNRIAPAIQPALEDRIPKRIKLISILLEHPRVLACHQIG